MVKIKPPSQPINCPGCDHIYYETPYYWRVEVYEKTTGLSSGWIYYDDIDGSDDLDGNSKTYTYPYSHPAPIPSFVPIPEIARPNQQIYFYDSSVCFDNNLNSFYCDQLIPSNCIDGKCYTWNFGDLSTSNTIGSVYHSYADPNTYYASLQVCDDFACCDITEDVSVKKAGFQLWKEISPF